MAKIADMQEVRLDLLKPYERNAKIHGEDQIHKLMDSIREKVSVRNKTIPQKEG